MSPSMLRWLATPWLLVSALQLADLPIACGQGEESRSPPTATATTDAGGSAAKDGTESAPFTLFPFITESRDPADGSTYYQAFGVYHEWSQVLPDGTVETDAWGLPTFYSGSKDDNYFTTFFPLYWSKGNPDDYFMLGLPLFYADYENDTGEGIGTGTTIVFPFYFHFWSSTDDERYVVPFYTRRVFPGESQHAFLGPLYVYQSFEDREGGSSGSAHSFLWPFITVEQRDDAYTYRLIPFFSVSRHGDSDSLLVTPFYYEQSDPASSFEYVFPFYATSESIGEKTDHWGMGLYTRGRGTDESGTVLSSRDDTLWGLISFQDDVRSGMKHERILPLAYWNTEDPRGKDTIFGPFYYEHISTNESDERWSLDLFLGNLFVSSVVEGPPVYERAPSTTDSGVEAATLERSDLPDPDTAAVEVESPDSSSSETGPGSLYPIRPERSVDKGVVWPLIRWYHDDLGREGRWVAPFYFDTKSDSSEKFALFPAAYTQRDLGGYELNFFRYFFLYNQERWSTGDRVSIGQILFDWTSEASRDLDEVSVLYPLFEFHESETGYGYHLLHLLGGTDASDGGERIADFRLFPFFWYGYEEREVNNDEWQRLHAHFYVLPFVGYEASTTRADYYALYPLIHYKSATDSSSFAAWPLFFWIDHPTVQALRIWPLHSSEAGETAGDIGWIDWLFLSKYAFRPGKFSYRLDPFLYSYESDEEEGTASLSLLFGIYQQQAAGEDRRHTLLWFLSF